MATLMRGVCFLRAVTRSSSSPSVHRRHFAAPTSSPTSERRSKILTSGVADALHDDDLLSDDDYTPITAVKKSDMPSLLQPRVVIYDGVCHLCHRGVKWVIKTDIDRKIKFCCLQSKAADPYMRLLDVDREDVLRRFLFIEGPYAYHQGSTAALRVLSYLPLPYSALSSLLIVPTPLRDAIYDYVANNRYQWLGREDDCLVLQEKELLERFIDRDELLDRSKSDL